MSRLEARFERLAIEAGKRADQLRNSHDDPLVVIELEKLYEMLAELASYVEVLAARSAPDE